MASVFDMRAMIVSVAVLAMLITRPSPRPTEIDVDWQTTGFDALRIAQLTRMAQQAYATPHDMPDELEGYRLVAHESVPFTMSMDVWEAESAGPEGGAANVVVAFSGTPDKCIRSVAKSLALVWKEPVRVTASSTAPEPALATCTHHYALTGLRMLLGQYRERHGGELRDWLADKDVTVTGHSRGGVAAMLLAHYELTDAPPPAVLAISAPPTFCAATAQRMEAAVPERLVRTLSVGASGDPVMSLQHTAGMTCSLEEAGNACADEFAHVGIVAEFRDGRLQPVQHERRTSLLGSQLDLEPHGLTLVSQAAECLAEPAAADDG